MKVRISFSSTEKKLIKVIRLINLQLPAPQIKLSDPFEQQLFVGVCVNQSLLKKH